MPYIYIYISIDNGKVYILDNNKLYPVVNFKNGMLFAIDYKPINKLNDSEVKETEHFNNANSSNTFYTKKYPSDSVHVYKVGEYVLKDDDHTNKYKINKFFSKPTGYEVSLSLNDKTVGLFSIEKINPEIITHIYNIVKNRLDTLSKPVIL